MALHHRIQTSKAWIDPTWLNSKWMENDCMVCQGAAIMAWQTHDFYEDLCLYSTSFQFMCFSCGYGTWKMKTLLQNDFSSKRKKYIDFSVYNFRGFLFRLKNCALFQAQKLHGILEAYFTVLIITSYQSGFSMPLLKEMGAEKIAHICPRNVSGQNKSFNELIFRTKC